MLLSIKVWYSNNKASRPSAKWRRLKAIKYRAEIWWRKHFDERSWSDQVNSESSSLKVMRF